MNSRNWADLENDEIFAIWSQYIRHEGFHRDPLCTDSIKPRTIRLTPMEIIRLVEELMNRLEMKADKGV